MAFIYEKILEKDWDLYNSFNLSYGGKKLIANKYKYWIIDRERKIYYILLGGGAFERPIEYALIWNDEIIFIDIESKVVRCDDLEDKLHYSINRILAPLILEPKEGKLIELIEEVCSFNKDDKFIIHNIAKPIFIEKE